MKLHTVIVLCFVGDVLTSIVLPLQNFVTIVFNLPGILMSMETATIFTKLKKMLQCQMSMTII